MSKAMTGFRRITFLLAIAALAACASPAPPPAALPEGFSAAVIFARTAEHGRGPLGVADRFLIDGRIVAYVSLSWTDFAAPWPKQKFDYRWYNADDKLVSRHETEYNFAKAPIHVWTAIYPATLGLGKARFELWWQGQKLAERTVDIVNLGTSPAPTPAGSKPMLSPA